MRIDPNVVVTPTQLDTTKARASGTAPPAKAGDVVQLSAAASSVAPAEARATNPERLERIRALIDAGDYAVDLDQLASRIVDDEVMRTRKLS